MKRWVTKSGYRIFQVLSGRSNVFLLTNGKKNILIDTSPGFMFSKLKKRLSQLKVSEIELLILTHTHYDHAANAARIKEKYKAKILVHKDEAAYLDTGENIVPEGTNFLSRIIVKLFAQRFLLIAKFEPCEYDLTVDSVFNLDIFGFNGYILPTPGHTPGSVSVIIDEEIALVGDAMFGVFPRSVFPPFANDVMQLIKSWGILLETKCSLFIPAHGSANSRSLVQKDYNNRM